MPRRRDPPAPLPPPAAEPDPLLAFAALADLAPDIVSVLEADGTLRFNSAAAERIHGYPPEEMLGRNTMDWIHPDDRPAVEAAFARLFSRPHESVRVRYRYRHRRGGWTPMEATGQNRLADPRVRGIIAISRDLSPKDAEGGLIPLEVGTYDPGQRRVLTATGAIALTPVEARLLEFLGSRPGQSSPADVLLREVWGYGQGVQSRTVYATIGRLRAKVERDAGNPACIQTFAGHGYGYVPPADPITSRRR